MNKAPRLLFIGGLLFLVIGGPMACLGVGTFQPPISPDLTLSDVVKAVIEMVIGIPLAYWGMLSLMQVRRFRAKSAEEVQQRDTRPPVIYLRSFKDDEKAAMVTQMGGLAYTAVFPSYVTEEEQIATAISKIGPFLAIGQPGEPMLDLRDLRNNLALTASQKNRSVLLRRFKLALQMGPLIFLMPQDKVLPDLGAARTYVGDHEWQDKVKSLLTQAQLVVLRAGETDNLLWEVETVARSVKPEKIIFLLPFNNKKGYDIFRQKVSAIFPKPFPEKYRYTWGMKFGSVKAILYFEPDWTPKIAPLKNLFLLFDSFFMPVVPRLHAALKPVYTQLGLEYKSNRINPWIVLVNVVGCLLVLLSLYLGLLVSSQP